MQKMMKRKKTFALCLLIGLISSLVSCDEDLTEPNLYPSYFYINDTSDSLFVSFHYSYEDYKKYLQQGYRSYSLGPRDTMSFLYGEHPDDIDRADTISMKNNKGEYLFYHADWGTFWSEKYYSVKNGEYTSRYFFIDDSTLAKCDTLLKN
jgi:hypothetical protein